MLPAVLARAAALASFVLLLDTPRIGAAPPWPLLLRWLPTPASAGRWAAITGLLVGQFCVVDVAMAIAAVATRATGTYCATSLGARFAHVWLAVVRIVAATVGGLAFVACVAGAQRARRVCACAAVVWLTFWQALVLDLVAAGGSVRAGRKVALWDVAVGFNALAAAAEMLLLAALHWWAFSPRGDGEPPAGLARALVAALNPWDVAAAAGRGVRWGVTGQAGRGKQAAAEEARAGEGEALVAVSNRSSGNGATTPVPGGWPSTAGRGWGGVYDMPPGGTSPGGGDGLLVEHPAPRDAVRVPQQPEIPTHGLVETHYEGYHPPAPPPAPEDTRAYRPLEGFVAPERREEPRRESVARAPAGARRDSAGPPAAVRRDSANMPAAMRRDSAVSSPVYGVPPPRTHPHEAPVSPVYGVPPPRPYPHEAPGSPVYGAPPRTYPNDPRLAGVRRDSAAERPFRPSPVSDSGERFGPSPVSELGAPPRRERLPLPPQMLEARSYASPPAELHTQAHHSYAQPPSELHSDPALPYPDFSSMPSIRRGVEGGYTYSDSMVDAEGVYRGPNPRRTGADDAHEDGEVRWKVV